MSNTERVLYFPEGKIMKTIICDDEKKHMFRARRDYTEICEREERFTCDRSFFILEILLLDYLKERK